MLVPIVEIAVAADVPRLVAVVAGLGAIRAVAADMAGLVAVIARQRRAAFALLASLGAVARDVAHLGAVVAGRLVRALRAVTGYVSGSVTPANRRTQSDFTPINRSINSTHVTSTSNILLTYNIYQPPPCSPGRNVPACCTCSTFRGPGCNRRPLRGIRPHPRSPCGLRGLRHRRRRHHRR